VKLVHKLTLALAGGMFTVLVVNGYFRVQREVKTLHADRAQDHAVLGRTLATAVAATWRSGNPTEAMRVIDEADVRARNGTRVRWMDGGPLQTPNVEAATLGAMVSGEAITRVVPRRSGDMRFTDVPVDVNGERIGVIELSEPLASEQRAVRSIVVDTVGMTLALTVVSVVLSMALGVWLVGRPIDALSNKARRIGQGDLSGLVHLESNDELALLAGEMNAMCGHLQETNDRLSRETAARIQALEQLRHADRLTTVGKLASGVAHELGTPLNVVSARASMIASGETSEAEAREYAKVIADASRRMTNIIKQLLTFARRNPATKAPCDLDKTARDTLDLLRPLAAKKRVELRLQSDAGGTSLTLSVDAGGVQQVLTNLIVNAVQAMPQGGAVDVDLGHARAQAPGAQTSASYVCIRVRDHGDGIAEDHLAHIFEPFYTTKDVGEGTGLGLSVTHGIIQDHGGFIDVATTAGQGTTFSVYLPEVDT
jgi:two-component system NtrC family sensor kinase